VEKALNAEAKLRGPNLVAVFLQITGITLDPDSV